MTIAVNLGRKATKQTNKQRNQGQDPNPKKEIKMFDMLLINHAKDAFWKSFSSKNCFAYHNCYFYDNILK